MILSGKRIHELVNQSVLVIDPFDPAHLNPNSYNLTLDNTLKVYEANFEWHTRANNWDRRTFRLPEDCGYPTWSDDHVLDMKKDNKTVDITIPEGGIVLYPGVLYLASTVEYTETPAPYTPMIEGRSSIGRLGMCIHVCAGFGDCQFQGNWTLELTVETPLRIYAGVQIAQMNYHMIEGEVDGYKGKYQQQRGPKPSGLWKEFRPKE